MEELVRKIIALKEEKEVADKALEEAKTHATNLDTEIDALQKELFAQIKETKEFKTEGKLDKEVVPGIFVTTFAKATTGYTDEAAVIKFLTDAKLTNLLTVKTTLNKKEINKALKTDAQLKDQLDSMTSTSVTEWCTVTKAENHQRMLEHIEEGKK